MKAAINKANCTLLAKNLLPDGTDIITDKDVQGFRARRYSKRVSLIFQYVFQGKKREIAIGTFGTVTPDNARKAAIKYAGLVADDKDPAAEKTARRTRTGKTVNALLDMAVAGHFKKKKTAATFPTCCARCPVNGKPILCWPMCARHSAGLPPTATMTLSCHASFPAWACHRTIS